MKLKHLIQPIFDDCQTILKEGNIDFNDPVINHGETGLKFMYDLLHTISRNRSFNDEHPFFKNGMIKRCLPYDGRDYCFYYENNDTDDSHLNSLLRKVKSMLILNQK
jgi:hypothetical protein